MRRYCTLLIAYLLLAITTASGKDVCDSNIKRFLRKEISIFADTSMYGRGYVKDGRLKAADYLVRRFKEIGLRPHGDSHTYLQPYQFPVNTFPGKVALTVNGKRLVPGQDYVVDASSASCACTNLSVKRIDLSVIADELDWQRLIASFDLRNTVYILDNIDSACVILNVKKHLFGMVLPEGCYIIPQSDKFIWTVSKEQVKATVFYVKPDLLLDSNLRVSATVEAQFLSSTLNYNIVGEIPGKVKDSFIAITAHYDHLGMMGDSSIFPGASDNASGTAMLLYLADYYAHNKPKYTVLLIAFSGEEAGLMGSEYYTRNPTESLENIKFLVNVDIMGDATDGVTVVNATELPRQFYTLERINERMNYVPAVKSRGRAANSDHYHFSEGGVPAFFIYTNGGKGYYHDIYDKPEELSLNHVDGITRLIIDFLHEIR
ncbi:MAG: M28 family peptidase [Chitinophagia bacterium]|nr:M28 family peptidase [Chitinophagia bacterium]